MKKLLVFGFSIAAVGMMALGAVACSGSPNMTLAQQIESLVCGTAVPVIVNFIPNTPTGEGTQIGTACADIAAVINSWVSKPANLARMVAARSQAQWVAAKQAGASGYTRTVWNGRYVGHFASDMVPFVIEALNASAADGGAK